MSNKWIWEDPFDNEYGIGDFPSFVCAITRRRPGWISEQYKRYIGPKGAPLVSFVGRQEFLVDDLVHALTLAGETFDEVALRNTPKVNQVATLSAWKDKAVFTSELIDLVRESEREALERFDYDYEYVSPLFENLLSPKKEALLVR